jgi:hypothetical protein
MERWIYLSKKNEGGDTRGYNETSDDDDLNNEEEGYDNVDEDFYIDFHDMKWAD